MLITAPSSRRPRRNGPRFMQPDGSSLRSRCGQRGMVTAEFAVVLPAVVLVLALSVGALGLAVDQIRCVDAASVGARAAARGDSAGSVTLVVGRVAPSGAEVSVDAGGDIVRVSVVSEPRVAAGLFPTWLRASASASTARESPDPQP